MKFVQNYHTQREVPDKVYNERISDEETQIDNILNKGLDAIEIDDDFQEVKCDEYFDNDNSKPSSPLPPNQVAKFRGSKRITSLIKSKISLSSQKQIFKSVLNSGHGVNINQSGNFAPPKPIETSPKPKKKKVTEVEPKRKR